MLDFFLSYSFICNRILYYFGFDISSFTSYQQVVIIVLCHILAILVIWFILTFLYKLFCRLCNII